MKKFSSKITVLLSYCLIVCMADMALCHRISYSCFTSMDKHSPTSRGILLFLNWSLLFSHNASNANGLDKTVVTCRLRVIGLFIYRAKGVLRARMARLD